MKSLMSVLLSAVIGIAVGITYGFGTGSSSGKLELNCKFGNGLVVTSIFYWGIRSNKSKNEVKILRIFKQTCYDGAMKKAQFLNFYNEKLGFLITGVTPH